MGIGKKIKNFEMGVDEGMSYQTALSELAELGIRPTERASAATSPEMEEDLRLIDKLEKLTKVSFSEDQRKILMHHGSGCIVACAGSGKTFTLTMLLAKRILSGEIKDTGKLICTTYSKGGTSEMEDKLNSLLRTLAESEPSLNGVEVRVTTLHAFFLSILYTFGLSKNIGILRDYERLNMIADAAKGACLDLKDNDLNDLSNLISFQVNNLMGDKQALESNANTLEHMSAVQYAEIRKTYALRKNLEGKMDFDDMQMYLYTYLVANKSSDIENVRNSAVAARNYCKYMWTDFYIDEAQDVSRLQFAILKEMVASEDDPNKLDRNIIFVGDDDQCLDGSVKLLTEDSQKDIANIRLSDGVASAIGYGAYKFLDADHLSKKLYTGMMVELRAKTQGGMDGSLNYSINGTSGHIGFFGLKRDCYISEYLGNGRYDNLGSYIVALKQRRVSRKVTYSFEVVRGGFLEGFEECRLSSGELQYIDGRYYMLNRQEISTSVDACEHRLWAISCEKSFCMAQSMAEMLKNRIDVSWMRGEHMVDSIIGNIERVTGSKLDSEHPFYKRKPKSLRVDFVIESIRKDGSREVAIHAHTDTVKLLNGLKDIIGRLCSKCKNVYEDNVKFDRKPISEMSNIGYNVMINSEGLKILKKGIEDYGCDIGVECVMNTYYRFTQDGGVYKEMPLSNIVKGSLVPVAVKEAGEIVDGYVYYTCTGFVEAKEVYDISMPNTRNMVAGGIVVHNCIYKWRGADPSIILGVSSKFGIKTLMLSTNYRCKNKIVDFAARSIKYNNSRYDKSIKAKYLGGLVRVARTNTSDLYNTSKLAFNYIETLVKNGEDPSSICVMSRNNFHLSILNNMLLVAGIYCTGTPEMKFTISSVYKDVKSMLEICKGDCWSNSVTQSILWKICRYMKATAARAFAQFQDSSGLTVTDMLAYVLKEFAGEKIELRKLNIPLQAKESMSLKWGGLRPETRMDVSQLYHWLASDNVNKKVMGILKMYQFNTDFMYKTEDQARFVKGMLNYAYKMVENNGIKDTLDIFRVTEQYEMNNMAVSGKKVNLSTIHGAKGKEWKHVIAFACDNISMPGMQSINNMVDEGQSIHDIFEYIDEERRLYYVECTRAKDDLLIITDRTPGVFVLESLGYYSDVSGGNDSNVLNIAQGLKRGVTDWCDLKKAEECLESSECERFDASDPMAGLI